MSTRGTEKAKMGSMTRTGVARAALMVSAACVSVAALGGCRGERSEHPPRQFLPDMDDQQKWKNQGGTEFFADGRMMRPGVAGTVAYGWAWGSGAAQNPNFLKDDDAFFRGVGPDGTALVDLPGSAVRAFAKPGATGEQALSAMILRGKERFNIFCAACHGYAGDGRGMVGQRWSYLPANFHDAKFVDRKQATGTDGHFFDVIRNGLYDANTGKYKMPAYGDKINESDAWAIVAYMRVLQESWVTPDSLPADKQELMKTKPRPTPGQARGFEAGGFEAGRDAVTVASGGTGTQHEGGAR